MKYELRNAAFALVVTAMAGGAAWAQTGGGAGGSGGAATGGTTAGATTSGTATTGTTTTPGTSTTPTTTTTSPTATQPPAQMPNSNPYTPEHTTGPNGTPMPDSATTVQQPGAPGSPPVACPNPAGPTTTTASPGTASTSCAPGPIPPKPQ